MPDGDDRIQEYGAGRKDLNTGRQPYHLAVPDTANAKDLSVVLYRAWETMSDAYRIPITLTHPDALTRGKVLRA
jgi:type VI secretion system secreted protein VgrG